MQRRLLSVLRQWFCCCCFIVLCSYLPLFVAVLCWSFFWYALLCDHSSFAKKRELVALLLLSFGYRVTVNVLWLFLTVSWVGLQLVIVVFQLLTYLFTIPLPKFRLLLSADNLCKQFWSHIRTDGIWIQPV